MRLIIRIGAKTTCKTFYKFPKTISNNKLNFKKLYVDGEVLLLAFGIENTRLSIIESLFLKKIYRLLFKHLLYKIEIQNYFLNTHNFI